MLHPNYASEHFIAYSRIPQLSLDGTLQEAFRAMSDARAGSLIVREGAQPRWYVSGVWLKRVLMEPGPLQPALPPQIWTMRSLLSRPPDQLSPAGHIPVAGEIQPLAIGGSISSSEDPKPLEAGAAAVFLVIDDRNQPLGWFLNHEYVVATFTTSPPEFVCENGHVNPDPDNGRCYRCPATIKT